MKRNAILGGTLTFCLPYCGRAQFDWWLDVFGHDVIVECTNPWKGLRTDMHAIGMAPKFTDAKAREIAEVLCRKILGNLELVIQHRNEGEFNLESYYDNQQLPLYREYASQESRRRFVEVGILAEAFKDDDDDDESPDNVMPEKYEEQAEEELKAEPVEVIEEVGPLSGDELKKVWGLQ